MFGRNFDLVEAVLLLEADIHALGARRRQVLTDVVGPDRKLAVTSVHQYRELDARRAPIVEERLDRSPRGAARVKDVVDQHDGCLLEREIDARRVHDRLAARSAGRDVVAVEADVDLAERNLPLEELLD